VIRIGPRSRRVLVAIGVLVPAPAAPRLDAQTTPAPFTFTSGAWQLILGGYFKLDLIHDFDANGSSDSFDPRSIPVDGTEGTNTRIHARETRLSLGVAGPAEGKELTLLLEGDFYGTGSAFRIRHAYARYGALLAGQTWTTVMDADNIPPTIDFETPLAAPFVRQGQLRITTRLSEQSDLAFAVEESDPEILIPPGVQGAPEKTWPDLTAHYRFTGRRGHVQLSAFLGQTRFRAAGGATSDVAIGGILGSGRLSLFPRDTAYLQLAYGPGVGRYRGAASAALDAAGRLQTVDVVGLTAGYLHYWTGRWSSNVVVSPAWVLSDVGDPATANDSFNYVAVNLLYWFIDQRAWIGGEYLYGRRELRSGAHGSDNRVQLATCFNILR
jgi:DcaP outer membrane protein